MLTLTLSHTCGKMRRPPLKRNRPRPSKITEDGSGVSENWIDHRNRIVQTKPASRALCNLNSSVAWAHLQKRHREIDSSWNDAVDEEVRAACWYSPTTFNLDVNFTDGNTHHICALRRGLGQLRDVGQTRSRLWNISGHVKIIVTSAGGTNAVVSGHFSTGDKQICPQ